MKPRFGAPAEDRRDLLRWLGPAVLGKVQMDLAGYARLLRAHPRLIVAATHGGVIPWLPLVMAMMRATIEVAPRRRIIGTMHPVVWKLPGMRRLATRLTGADEPYTLPELQTALSGASSLDYYAFPESEHCLYGELGEVKAFRFLGFIELSIRTQVPMLLVAHRGSERWYHRLRLSGSLSPLLDQVPAWAFERLELNKDSFIAAIEHEHDLNVPFMWGRLDLDLAFELYRPQLFSTGLAEDWKTRRRQVAEEGSGIRYRLQALYDSLRPRR